MTRDLEWLLAACRFWLTGDADDAPRRDPADWRALAGLAYFHDLDPLLHRLASPSLLDLESRLPERVRRQWEHAYYRNFVFHTELLDLLELFLAGCQRQDLEVRVFKGPVTAVRGWIDPTLRIMADVDLFCRRSDLPRLAELARELHFDAGEQTATHHLALAHASLPGSLELHFEPYEVMRNHDRLTRELWRPPTRVVLEGRRLPALDPALAAIFDLGHLLQHDLEVSLRQLLDLAATLWRQRLDRRRLWELAAAADLAPELAAVLAVLERLGLPVKAGLAEAPPPAAAGELEAAVVKRLLSADELDRVGVLAGPHRRGGAAATAGYLLRRLLPPLEQVQAMTGAASRRRALLGYPAHVAATLGRAARRWRRGGVRPPAGGGFSLKAALYRRRAG